MNETATNKLLDLYNHSDHIAILSEIITLTTLVNETQCKIQVAKEKEKKMLEQQKEKDEII